MRIAITGAGGTVGREVVKLCSQKGHKLIQIYREETSTDNPNSETRVADLASSYADTVAAFKSAEAVIHLAAIPNPVDKEDSLVHSNNVNAAFNGFRACGELGIKKICYASSVNAIGLAYANQPLEFDYFPIDEDHPMKPTDAYALAKQETEIQAQAFVNWFQGTRIACLRIHQVAPMEEVRKEHEQDWEASAVKQLWSWVSPQATARACLQAVENSDNWEGCEVFNIVAPTTTQSTPSVELAKKYFPEARIRPGLEGNSAFWTIEKAERLLKWNHYETE